MIKVKIIALSALAGFVMVGCQLPDKLPLPDLSMPSSNKTCNASMSDRERASCISHKTLDKISAEECSFLQKYTDEKWGTQRMRDIAIRCTNSEPVDIDLDKLMKKNK